MTLHLEIVTPEKVVYRNEVDEIIAPTTNGQIAILPNHVALLTQIIPGEIVIKKGKDEQPLAITGGFLEIINNKVTILADYAVRAEEIEVLKVEEAKRKAEKRMEEKISAEDLAKGEAEMIRAITQLRVATKYKRHSKRPQEI